MDGNNNKGDDIMKITITGRKCSPRDSFKERVQKKLTKIEKFFGEGVEAKVTVTVEKAEQIVEITLKNRGLIFRAEESAENMNDAFDKCVNSLIRQIRKNKTRVEKRLRSGSLDDLVGASNENEEASFDLVRSKTIRLKPEDIDEAILQMNMLGHQFYMFLNAQTNAINVVYLRKDGGYGLLEPGEE